jgi:hypothetical protein
VSGVVEQARITPTAVPAIDASYHGSLDLPARIPATAGHRLPGRSFIQGALS